MAKSKKQKDKPEKPKELKLLYTIVPPGVCPYCGKGPIIIMARESYPVVIDKAGQPVMLGDVNAHAYGLCFNCKKKLGEFIYHNFNWYPAEHPDKDLSMEQTGVRPSYNFFGNKAEQLGEQREWIMLS